MSSPTATYRSPFQLSHVSLQQSAFLSLPLELRYTVYAEIFQPRIYYYEREMGFIYVHHEECRYVISQTYRCPQPCFLSHHTCRCSFGRAVSLLRTCQQIYVEAQPHFLLSATLKLCARSDKADQLRQFHRKFLCSSLSGLVPGDCLRRLDLRLAEIPDYPVYDDLNVINDCRLRLDYLQLHFVNRSLPSYCNTDFISGGIFKAMSLLRDIKNVQLTWGHMSRTLVRASDEPEIYTQYFSCGALPPSDLLEFEAYRDSLQKRYCGLLNRAFSELTSRPRTTKGRKRFTTLHKEAKASFCVKMQELMGESPLYLASDT